MREWSENRSFYMYVKSVCHAFNSKYGTQVEPRQLSHALVHKLEQLEHVLGPQNNSSQEATQVLDSQYRLFLSRLVEDENRIRAHNNRLSLDDLERQLGPRLREIYLTTEYLGFAFKDATKLIDHHFPTGRVNGHFGIQALINSKKR